MSIPETNASGAAKEYPVSDILAYVALQQTALSNLLNDNTEKLQKIIESEDFSELVSSANTSVSSMINAVRKLELMLRNRRLSAFPVRAAECKQAPRVTVVPEVPNAGYVYKDEASNAYIINLHQSKLPARLIIQSEPTVPVKPLSVLPAGFTLNNNMLTVPAGAVSPQAPLIFEIGTGSCAAKAVLHVAVLL